MTKTSMKQQYLKMTFLETWKNRDKVWSLIERCLVRKESTVGTLPRKWLIDVGSRVQKRSLGG